MTEVGTLNQQWQKLGHLTSKNQSLDTKPAMAEVGTPSQLVSLPGYIVCINLAVRNPAGTRLDSLAC